MNIGRERLETEEKTWENDGKSRKIHGKSMVSTCFVHVSWRCRAETSQEEAMPGSQQLTAPLTVEERRLIDLLQSMAAKAAQRFHSMSRSKG